jgi:hypothetical protein
MRILSLSAILLYAPLNGAWESWQIVSGSPVMLDHTKKPSQFGKRGAKPSLDRRVQQAAPAAVASRAPDEGAFRFPFGKAAAYICVLVAIPVMLSSMFKPRCSSTNAGPNGDQACRSGGYSSGGGGGGYGAHASAARGGFGGSGAAHGGSGS